MKHNLKEKRTSPCTTMNMPVPEFITCPKCGGEVELWPDEEETACTFCGHKIFSKMNILH